MLPWVLPTWETLELQRQRTKAGKSVPLEETDNDQNAIISTEIFLLLEKKIKDKQIADTFQISYTPTSTRPGDFPEPTVTTSAGLATPSQQGFNAKAGRVLTSHFRGQCQHHACS